MASLLSKLIFPSWCLTGIKTEDQFSTEIVTSRGSEVTNSNWSESRFILNLSGGLVSEDQHRYLKAVNRIVRGRAKTMYYRRYNDPEWELDDEFLGVGDGVQTVFQARLYDNVQGRESVLNVYVLDHDISPVGEDVNGLPATKTRFVEVRVNGQLKTLGTHYTVQRELGTITFLQPPASGAKVTLSGGFFVEVRLSQEGIETEPAGVGWYRITGNVALVQPKKGRD